MHKLTLFTDSICFSKAVAMKRLRKVVGSYSGFKILEKDLVQEAGEARRLGVRMSPTLVLDGKILCVGIPGEDELGQLIRERLGRL